jgi:hypothetical protein
MKVDLDVCKTKSGAWTPTCGFGVAGGESDWAVCTLQEGEGKGISFVGQVRRLGSYISRDYIWVCSSRFTHLPESTGSSFRNFIQRNFRSLTERNAPCSPAHLAPVIFHKKIDGPNGEKRARVYR